MVVIEVGESAAHLDWLWPDESSLRAMSRPLCLASWHAIRHDPAALMLIATTEISSSPERPEFRFHHARLVHSVRRVVREFDATPRLNHAEPLNRFLDWQDPLLATLLTDATRLARMAETIALYTRACDPAIAWIAGMLAPLGWFAVASHDLASVAACFADPDYPRHSLEAESEIWGRNHSEIALRVSRRMNFPAWLRVVVGHLNLSAESVRALGGCAEIVATVRLSSELLEKQGAQLKLVDGTHLANDLKTLGLDGPEVPAIEARFREVDTPEYLGRTWKDPRSVPLLNELLEACLGDRLLQGPDTASIELEVDRLHGLVHHHERDEQYRLEDARVASLAEFAAGAAHEINNPLAVISGQAQYLLKAEAENSRRDSLESIVRQVNRIHSILTDVMQFARPSRPVPKSLSLKKEISAAIDLVRPIATTKRVTIECRVADPEPLLMADEKQMRSVFAALLRNGVEAASADGWVRVTAQTVDDQIVILVEDSGPGLDEHQLRHAFDPFFSGRTAGRGRGFGLPIAWRLAKENGGEVRHESGPGQPTRFVVRMPVSSADAKALRLSA